MLYIACQLIIIKNIRRQAIVFIENADKNRKN